MELDFWSSTARDFFNVKDVKYVTLIHGRYYKLELLDGSKLYISKMDYSLDFIFNN